MGMSVMSTDADRLLPGGCSIRKGEYDPIALLYYYYIDRKTNKQK